MSTLKVTIFGIYVNETEAGNWGIDSDTHVSVKISVDILGANGMALGAPFGADLSWSHADKDGQQDVSKDTYYELEHASDPENPNDGATWTKRGGSAKRSGTAMEIDRTAEPGGVTQFMITVDARTVQGRSLGNQQFRFLFSQILGNKLEVHYLPGNGLPLSNPNTPPLVTLSDANNQGIIVYFSAEIVAFAAPDLDLDLVSQQLPAGVPAEFGFDPNGFFINPIFAKQRVPGPQTPGLDVVAVDVEKPPFNRFPMTKGTHEILRFDDMAASIDLDAFHQCCAAQIMDGDYPDPPPFLVRSAIGPELLSAIVAAVAAVGRLVAQGGQFTPLAILDAINGSSAFAAAGAAPLISALLIWLNYFTCAGGHFTVDVESRDLSFMQDVGFPGHLNWSAITSVGYVEMGASAHSTPDTEYDRAQSQGGSTANAFESAFGADDDYQWDLTLNYPPYLTRPHAGLTSQSGDVIELEFDSEETIDHFTTGWWDEFHKLVDQFGSSNDPKDPTELAINTILKKMGSHNGERVDPVTHGQFPGPRAVVIGLYGLDLPHSPGAESHPVYAMALRVRTSEEVGLPAPSDSPGLPGQLPPPIEFSWDDERWAVFARTFGNEGFCGTHQHRLYPPSLPDQNVLHILIPIPEVYADTPWRVVGFQMKESDPQASHDDIVMTPAFLKDRGVVLTIDFGHYTPDDKPLFHDTIRIAWTVHNSPGDA